MLFGLCIYSFGDAMEDQFPLSYKQPSASLASDQGLSMVAFSTDHSDKASIHSSDAKLDTIQSIKEPSRRKSVSSMHGFMVAPYKVVLIAGIIFIIALFSMPIILFYSLSDSSPDSSQKFMETSQVTKK